LRYSLFEGEEGFRLEHTEGGEFGSGQIFVVERGEVEALVSGEDVVGDDFGGEIQMLLILFSPLCLELLTLGIESCFCSSAHSPDDVTHLDGKAYLFRRRERARSSWQSPECTPTCTRS
jgi:hypothetical protein